MQVVPSVLTLTAVQVMPAGLAKTTIITWMVAPERPSDWHLVIGVP